MVKDPSCASLLLTNIQSKPVFWIKKPTLNWKLYISYLRLRAHSGQFNSVICAFLKSHYKKILNRAHYITLTYDYDNTFNTIYASSLMTRDRQ